MGYISKFGTHTNGNIIFIKPNEVPLVGNPPQSMSLNALHVRKLKHNANKCYSRLFENINLLLID